MISALDATSKTLLYGYTLERESHHTFQHQGLIHTLIYNYDKEIIFEESGVELEISKIIPTKRLYPNLCDYEFCQQLMSRGYEPPFTTFNEEQVPSEPGIYSFTNIAELETGLPGPKY